MYHRLLLTCFHSQRPLAAIIASACICEFSIIPTHHLSPSPPPLSPSPIVFGLSCLSDRQTNEKQTSGHALMVPPLSPPSPPPFLPLPAHSHPSPSLHPSFDVAVWTFSITSLPYEEHQRRGQERPKWQRGVRAQMLRCAICTFDTVRCQESFSIMCAGNVPVQWEKKPT